MAFSGVVYAAHSDLGPSTGSIADFDVVEVFRQDETESGTAFVSHNREVQRLFDELKIAWGVQYEIARGVSDGRWGWHNVTKTKLEQLNGTNAESAPFVSAVILRQPKPRINVANTLLW